MKTSRYAAFPVAITACALVFCAPPAALAHHILGIPHYSYEKDYPQTPVLTYRVDAGPYDVKLTGYPGVLEPGDACVVHVYISDRASGELYDGPVVLTVRRDRLLGEDPVIYGPVEARLDERLYKFYPRFEREADYTLHLHFDAHGSPWNIELPLVVGEPGSPWALLTTFLLGCGVFVILIRALRIKAARRRRRAAADGGAAVTVGS